MKQLTAIPELVLLPTATTKNHNHKIKLVNENGAFCQYCNKFKDVDDLTLDHIRPKWLADAEHYDTDQNKRLLCKSCHGEKSEIEQIFKNKITREVFKAVSLNGGSTMIDISDIILQYKELTLMVLKEWRLLTR